MAEMEHEEIKGLLASYAIGAIDADEGAVVRAHLLECEECSAEVDLLSESGALLAATVAPETPPPGFADAVLEQVRGEVPEVELVPERPRRSRWVPVFQWAFVAASLILVGFFALQLSQTRSDLDAANDALLSLMDDAHFTLSAGEAQAGVVQTASGSVFLATGMDEAPEGKDYQLWYIDEGGPTSAGVFDVEGGVATLESGVDPNNFDVAAVTLEPEGGSPEPTTEPLMASP